MCEHFRFYKSEKDWTSNIYDRAVTPSDEAFIWQVMTFYPSFWKKEGDQDDDDSMIGNSAAVSIGGSSSGTKSVKAGAKQGFTDTAGKTMSTYVKYLKKMGDSRTAENAKKWSDRLLLIARQGANRKKKAAEPTPAPPVMTIAPSTDFLLYAPNICEWPADYDMKAYDVEEDGDEESMLAFEPV
jgi:hypothetical protein